MGDHDIFAHALANLSEERKLQSFAVKHSSTFVNEYGRRDDHGNFSDGGIENPNHLLGAFPVLFPYGKGGLEVDRRRKVPYKSHVRWALQYGDGRFRKDLSFIFKSSVSSRSDRCVILQSCRFVEHHSTEMRR